MIPGFDRAQAAYDLQTPDYDTSAIEAAQAEADELAADLEEVLVRVCEDTELCGYARVSGEALEECPHEPRLRVVLPIGDLRESWPPQQSLVDRLRQIADALERYGG